MRNSLLWKRASVPMSGCLRHWLTCRRQGDLRRGNSRPNVWCNWNKCATEKGLVSNSGDRRDDDHAWRSSAIGFLLTHNAFFFNDTATTEIYTLSLPSQVGLVALS